MLAAGLGHVEPDDEAWPKRADGTTKPPSAVARIFRCVTRAVMVVLMLPLAPFKSNAQLAASDTHSLPILAPSLPDVQPQKQKPASSQHGLVSGSKATPAAAADQASARRWWWNRGDDGTDAKIKARRPKPPPPPVAAPSPPPPPAARAASPPAKASSPPAKASSPPAKASSPPAKPWRPPARMVAARRYMIQEIVRLDTSSLLQRFASAVPKAMMQRSRGAASKDSVVVDAAASLDAIREPMRDLQRHSSLLQWHVNENVLPADVNTLLSPTLDTYANTILPVAESFALPRASRPTSGLPSSAERKGRGKEDKRLGSSASAGARGGGGASSAQDLREAFKAPELKDALLEVSPAFFSLVREAAKQDPSASARLYRRVAGACGLLLWWNAGRLVRAGPQRQYPLMNAFLEQILVTVTECQGVLGCQGDDECVIAAVEKQQHVLARKSMNPPMPRRGGTKRSTMTSSASASRVPGASAGKRRPPKATAAAAAAALKRKKAAEQSKRAKARKQRQAAAAARKKTQQKKVAASSAANKPPRKQERKAGIFRAATKSSQKATKDNAWWRNWGL